MKRFFIDLSYCGTRFNGWQNQNKQKHSRCVQNILEEALDILTRDKHEVTGCGRTDSGVHARNYMAHTDSTHHLNTDLFLDKINRFLPEDIVIHQIFPVTETAHARFDAISRSYVYYLHTRKTPFPELSYFYPYRSPDLKNLNEAAGMLKDHEDFYTFCKTRTDVKTTRCIIQKAIWVQTDDHHFEFHITADRFLRGMVRLIVGMCLDVDREKLTLEQVKHSLQTRKRLLRDWSVPAIGLFLQEIEYPLIRPSS